MEKCEFKSRIEQPEQKEEMGMSEVKFEDLKKGDKLIIDTSDDPERYIKQYEIRITDMPRTKKGELKDLVVEFKQKGKTIIAKMPGDFVISKKKGGVTKGTITNAKNHCLYFKNLNYRDRFEKTKSGKRRIRFAHSTRTTQIRKIVLKPVLID